MLSYTFLIAALLLAITPGPGMAYVVARTAVSGVRVGLACCFGTAMGGLLHVMASALGLSLLMAQSAWVFGLLKYLGAAYLVYLGWRILMRQEQVSYNESSKVHSIRSAWFEGVVVEALNIKTALFFLAFLPQFLDVTEPVRPQLVMMGSLCVVFNTLADILAVLLAGRLFQTSASRHVRVRQMKRVSGVTMMSLGVWLALTRRTT